MSEVFYAYHVVTEKPMHLGQHIVFDDNHHSGVYQRVMDKLDIVKDIYKAPQNYENTDLEHPVAVALRELALEEVRKSKYPHYPSHMSCLYVSETLQESVQWADYFVSLGRPSFQIVKDGKVVANVSVNRTDMLINGTVLHFIQLGTVMTDEAYRKQGLIRRIMEEIDADYSDTTDGFYLFGSDSVLDFYPKFGFRQSKEYLYSRAISNDGEFQFEQVIMDSPVKWKLLVDAMNRNVFHGRFDMVGNNELIMFYVTKYMQDSVYYHKPTDTYIIADIEADRMFLHNIFSSTIKYTCQLLPLSGKAIKKLTLGFAPADTENYEISELHGEDCTFFIKGNATDIIERERLRIPSLSHA